MSQQGDAREDDWWDQLYEESAPDTGPDRAADTLDDRFASAIHTVRSPQEQLTREDSPPPSPPEPPAPPSPPEPPAPPSPPEPPAPPGTSGPSDPASRAFPPTPPEPAAPWPAAERLGRPYVPGARPLPPEAEDSPPLPRRPLAPETEPTPPLPQRLPRHKPATPDGFTGWFGASPERGTEPTPPPPPAGWTGAAPRRGKGTPVAGAGTPDERPAPRESTRDGSDRAAPDGADTTADRAEPEGFGPPPAAYGIAGTTTPADRPEPGAEPEPREGTEEAPGARAPGPAQDGPRPEPVRNGPEPVRNGPEPVRGGPPWPGTTGADAGPPGPVRDEPAPPRPAPRVPRHALPPSPPGPAAAERAPARPDQPGEDGPASGEDATPRTDRAPAAPVPPLPYRPAPGPPVWPRPAAAPREDTSSPAAPPRSPVPPPAAPAPVPPGKQRDPSAPSRAAREPAAHAELAEAPVPPAASVPYVGDRPPTYEAEPTALAESDPAALDAYVPDTVLEGGRFGGSTLRAVSQRGDSARYRGEARRDALLVVRFGAGDEGIVLVAAATGARACPEAYRAATEAVRSIGAAVGRSHRRLGDDIRAARRGDLKSGLHRLTDRTLGRLRAAAAARGLAPEEYTASLRCLLLPTDGQCRTRVFFGAGEGGLFRLRGGELRDIEPEVPAEGQPRSGPEAGALTLDPGIGRPPSPYAPVEEPRREPFRFRASIARSGDVLLLCGTGLAEPLRGSPPLASRLAEEWSAPEPPGLAAFLATSQTRVKGYADDRTLAAVWER
ncbi:protein phosphatase 2C domain-containing protein [Streptomyces sp. P6-2-1]|uniref:protein phosphatase 2C domain-containing protein n=1 Tax=Streptomyces sp. P6-2-1 TaxID=3422591 RepID=UPI003D35B058